MFLIPFPSTNTAIRMLVLSFSVASGSVLGLGGGHLPLLRKVECRRSDILPRFEMCTKKHIYRMYTALNLNFSCQLLWDWPAGSRPAGWRIERLRAEVRLKPCCSSHSSPSSRQPQPSSSSSLTSGTTCTMTMSSRLRSRPGGTTRPIPPPSSTAPAPSTLLPPAPPRQTLMQTLAASTLLGATLPCKRARGGEPSPRTLWS